MSIFDASISKGTIIVQINSDESFTAHINYNEDVVSALINFIYKIHKILMTILTIIKTIMKQKKVQIYF